MLRKETERNFIVYPSWAELPAKWDDLPRLFADPLNSGFIQRGFEPQRYGYPEQIQPYEITSGPVGGGIIVWRGDPYRGRWLPLCVVGHEAMLRLPCGTDKIYKDVQAEAAVFYLDPMGAPGWQMGLAKKPLNFRPVLSMLHADLAGAKIYWIVRYKRAKRAQELKRLHEIPSWANHFGLEARRLASVPEAVVEELSRWFADPAYDTAWFEVSGDDDGVGYHFAVMVYIGNHLRWVAGPRMERMYLIADIEGQPRGL
jgi:hypothetical protein